MSESFNSESMSDVKNVYFMDFEAFQHGKEDYTVKELALRKVNYPYTCVSYVFRAQKPWSSLSPCQQRTYAYQEHKLHGLAWNEGEDNFCGECLLRQFKREFPRIANKNSIIYILGPEKTSYLQKFFPSLNIIMYKNVTLKDLPQASLFICCHYRNHSRIHCAVIKTFRLSLHYSTIKR